MINLTPSNGRRLYQHTNCNPQGGCACQNPFRKCPGGCTDTAVEVLKRFYIKEKDAYSMRVAWWNVGTRHTPWDMRITQRVRIKRQDWENNWRVYGRQD